MNVLITPRTAPRRTDLYSGIDRVYSDGRMLWLVGPRHGGASGAVFLSAHDDGLPLHDVAEIALDEEAGNVW